MVADKKSRWPKWINITSSLCVEIFPSSIFRFFFHNFICLGTWIFSGFSLENVSVCKHTHNLSNILRSIELFAVNESF